ncbi:MAG TPA: hypothetical protein VFO16_20290 [Pseudonocardiaceae bacterium]|nr:hypothetical protein [Pseudonocardiaceae bacterium]
MSGVAEWEDLLDALDHVGGQPGRPVSAHLDPALTAAAKVAVSLGLADSVSALTSAALQAELRRLAPRGALEEVYRQQPGDRPSAAEVAHFLATARKLPVARHPELPMALQKMADVMDPDIDPEILLAATAGHLAIRGSAA